MELQGVKTEHLKMVWEDIMQLRMKVFYVIGDAGFDIWDELGFMHNDIDAEIQRRQQTA